jgi:2-polyprenyl-3-methyl-5-hydroxy-6-metoxy-1,4-benzoquinol methylase
MQTELIKCPLCNGGYWDNESELVERIGFSPQRCVRSDNGLDIVKCTCGMYLVNPQPTEEACNNFYNNSPSYEDNKANRKAKTEVNVIHDVIEREIRAHLFYGSILDIGCGEGSLLKRFKSGIWKKTGTEYSDVEIKKAEKYGTIYKGDYLKKRIRVKPDVIVMSEVLEHVKDPAAYITKISKDLNPCGLAIITVPNNNWGLKRGYKNNLTTNLHLSYFTEKTLQEMIEKYGQFKEVKFVVPTHYQFYESYLKTTITNVWQFGSYCLFKLTGLNVGRGIIAVCRK